MPLIRVWQGLFVVCLLAMLFFGLNAASNIQIDTNLADIAPTTQTDNNTKAAVATLQKNIQQRIVLLISAANEDSVFAAQDYLRAAIEVLPNIRLHPSSDELAENLIDHLMPYRFSLLSLQQRTDLPRTSAQEIAEQAQQSLYSLSSAVRLFSFEDDPFSIHSETLLSLLSAADSNPDNHVAALNLSISQDALNIQTQATLTQALDAAIAETAQKFDVQLDRSGIFFFAAHAAKKSKHDISLISTVSTIGVVLLLLLVFRSSRALLLPIVSIGLGVGFAFIVTHSLFGKVHVLTIVFGAGLIGIVIDYSLHYFYHGANQNTRNIDSGNTSSERQALFRALALSLMTSLIGYAALGFSSLLALQKVAVFSCCGLFMAWLSVICLGDLALKRPLRTETKLLPAVTRQLRQLVSAGSNRQWASLAVCVLLAGATLALVANPYSDDPRVFFKAPSKLLESERRVARATSDYEPGRYIIISGQTRNQVYQRYGALLAKVKATTTLAQSQFTSIMNWVPSQAQQEENYRTQSLIYGVNGAVEKLYQSLGNDAGAIAIQQAYLGAKDARLAPKFISELLSDATPPLWFEDKSRVVSFVLFQKGVNADELSSIVTELDGVEYINTVERTKLSLKTQRKSASTLLLLAYALVALLVTIRFKTPKAIWLLAVPTCATAMLLIISVSVGLTLNLFHFMALFLVLGFGMDYAIFARELRKHTNITLQAIFLSAITSLLSFGLLAVSSIPVVASFGITLLIGNSFNLFGAFIYAHTQSD